MPGHVSLAPADLARWQAAAARLGGPGTALAVELAEVALAPTPHRLALASAAARFAASLHVGGARDLAEQTAAEIDEVSSRSE